MLAVLVWARVNVYMCERLCSCMNMHACQQMCACLYVNESVLAYRVCACKGERENVCVCLCVGVRERVCVCVDM